MKKLALLMTVCMFAFVTNTSAQFVNTGNSQKLKNSSNSGSLLSNMTTDNYARLTFSYNPVKLKWEHDQDLWDKALPLKHGFTVGVIGGVNLTNKAPLYLEYGLNYQGAFGKYKVDDDAIRTNLHSLNIPLNLAFRLSFNDNKISITPYVGLNGRINLAGSQKVDYFDNRYYDDEKYDLFDDSTTSEEGVGKQAFKRFQIGMNLGVGFSFSAFYLGVGHTFDFTKIANWAEADYEAKYGVTSISIGVNF